MLPKRHLLLAIAALPVLLACAGTPDPAVAPADDTAFMAWLRNLTDRLKADPYAKPLPMKGKFENDAFLTRLHDAYRKRTSREAFATWFNGQYPGFLYEGSVITEQLPR
ncbi:hypothetical protein [Piscinibacter gummiphilus]|uniref:Uncharacterized protein n=1 Tax=Piscinibacter gummiphilus TaxID=946333 RepID=A0A1W6L380_9BURK|nr:hypothetical protein [Piscinibacter gummiphilus]ARN18722.1 hypothetical protein A4W93_01635 [Piscinibacter gummiphilus]ATU63363.1 hypothetical protein CPZ87_01690 [Piscinibacter gummiphilus]GLS95873.1 hypothetical protein GCM10007918_31650 [Piscinibacter gummiphilus]